VVRKRRSFVGDRVRPVKMPDEGKYRRVCSKSRKLFLVVSLGSR
jgi:hypothetical protein